MPVSIHMIVLITPDLECPKRADYDFHLSHSLSQENSTKQQLLFVSVLLIPMAVLFSNVYYSHLE